MKKSVLSALAVLSLLFFYQNCSQSITPVSMPQQEVQPEPEDNNSFQNFNTDTPTAPEPTPAPVVTMSEPEPEPGPTPVPGASDLNPSSYTHMKIVDDIYGVMEFAINAGMPTHFSVGNAPCLQNLAVPNEVQAQMADIFNLIVDSSTYDFMQWYKDLNMYQNQVTVILVDNAGNEIEIKVPHILLPDGYPAMEVEGFIPQDLVAMLVTEACVGTDESTGMEVDITTYLQDFATDYLTQVIAQYGDQLSGLLGQ